MLFLFIYTKIKYEIKSEIQRQKEINSIVSKDLENIKRLCSSSHSDDTRQGRRTPKNSSVRKHKKFLFINPFWENYFLTIKLI